MRHLTVGGHQLEVSPRVALWMQPVGEAFRVTITHTGGLVGTRVRAALSRRLGGVLEVDANTAGWVSGIAQLDKAVNARVGVYTVP